MGFRPIEIDIKDDKKFTDVALLVDNFLFIKEILRIREAIFGFMQDPSWVVRNKEKITRIKLKKDESPQDTLTRVLIIQKEARRLRKKFHRPPTFDTVIESVILRGKVEDKDYKLCYPTVIDPKYYNPKLEDPLVVIAVFPGTRLKDVSDVFRNEIQKFIKGNDYRIYGNFFEKTFNKDTRSNIKVARRLYWANRKGIGYKKLHSRFMMNIETIKSSIKDYASLKKRV